MPEKDLDRKIVEVLLNQSRMTLPKLTKVLGSNVGTVDYHLKKLAEKGIVIVEKKKYGSTYRLNLDLVNVSKTVIFQLACSIVSILIGIIMLFQLKFLIALACFFVSSIAGLISIVSEYRRQSREKLEMLLESLS
ncbi:MAG: winged helix-turn-helix transcriptional regulator [Candidatus Baldrarchaeia archaeon]